MTAKRIIIFDGVCNLCSGSVNFIIRRDPHAQFSFAALQSETGRALLLEHRFDPETAQSIVLLDGDSVFTRSDAALRIAARLSGLWKWLTLLQWVPRPVRDWVYDRIAANRYRWFGKKDVCIIPAPDVKSRFLS